MGITILLATHNKAKLKELTRGFLPLSKKGVKIVSLADLKIHQEPKEEGKTFEENSLMKAKYYATRTKLPTVADDGGITITGLKGEPGSQSKRWMGKQVPDEELIAYTLKRMEHIPHNNREAYMQTVLTFFDPTTDQFFSETERIKGHISDKINPHYQVGFPYRALFVVEAFHKYYDDLTPEEHSRVNHRLLASERLSQKIKNYLLQLKAGK